MQEVPLLLQQREAGHKLPLRVMILPRSTRISDDQNLLALGVAPAIHSRFSVLALHELEPSRRFGDALARGIEGQTR